MRSFQELMGERVKSATKTWTERNFEALQFIKHYELKQTRCIFKNKKEIVEGEKRLGIYKRRFDKFWALLFGFFFFLSTSIAYVAATVYMLSSVWSAIYSFVCTSHSDLVTCKLYRDFRNQCTCYITGLHTAHSIRRTQFSFGEFQKPLHGTRDWECQEVL